MMLATASPEHPGTSAQGRLSTMLMRLLTKRATVVANEQLADRFRLITLEGSALEGVAWTPGQKVQVVMGAAFVTRTYTPIEWNASTGQVRLLGYVHGDGPGSTWLCTTRPGDECDIFGPRGSLDLLRLSGPLAIFGDETSIGLAHAAAHQREDRTVVSHFEVFNVSIAGDVLTQLGVHDAALFARRNDDAQVNDMAAQFPSLAAAGAIFVLTGKASTIQNLRLSLRQLPVPATGIVAKAYWAPGKIGLD